MAQNQLSSGDGTFPSSGGVGVKGSWTEAIASADFDATQLGIQLRQGSASYTRMVFDVGIGAAGSEVVLIPDLLVDTGNSAPAITAVFPVSIPAGTRVSLREASSASGHASGGQIWLGDGRTRVAKNYFAMGKGGTGYEGTTLDPGGTANTKSAWVELEDSTPNRADLLWLAVGIRDNATPSAYAWKIDIGVGAASSEVVEINELSLAANTTLFTTGFMGPFGVDIPAGSRVAARVESTGTEVTDRLIAVMAYGATLAPEVPAPTMRL